MPKIQLDRDVLAKFLPNHQAIREFEKVMEGVSITLPTLIEQASNDAASAASSAVQALALLQDVLEGLTQLLAAPAPQPEIEQDDFDPAPYPDAEQDDFAPIVQVGTIAIQNADDVEITGGTAGLDAGTQAAPSFYLGGESTTGFYRIALNNWGWSCGGTLMSDWSATTWKLSFAGVLAVEWSATASKWSYGAAETVLMDANGLEVKNSGYLKVAGGFGCNTKAPQPPVVMGATAAAPAGGVGTAAGGWDTAAHRDAAIAAINANKAAIDIINATLIANGIGA